MPSQNWGVRTTESPADRLAELDPSTSLELLKMLDVGRVAWADADTGRIVILPVNFAFDGADVVIRTASKSLCQAAVAGTAFSFQGDDVESSVRGGWAVLANGEAEMVTDQDQVERLSQLVTTWRDLGESKLIRFRLSDVTGRRLIPRRGSIRTVYVSPGDVD